MEGLELYPGERVWFTRPRGIAGLEVQHARDSPRLWKVWHNTYTLCITYAGGDQSDRAGAFWRYRGSDLTIEPGEVMLMEPGEMHVTRRLEHGPASFDVFTLQPWLVEELGRELGLSGPLHLSQARSGDPRLYVALEELARGVYLDDDPLAQQQRLLRVLWLVLSRCAEKRAEQPEGLSKVQVSRVREYFQAHYADAFDLDRLADACRVSKSSICHELPRWLGVTPLELQTVLRARRAKDLLTFGVAPAEVAAQVGFADQPQLTRHFKRFWGVTPARYARMVGGCHTP